MNYKQGVTDITGVMNDLIIMLGALRDRAHGHDKALFNKTRGLLKELVLEWEEKQAITQADDLSVGSWPIVQYKIAER